MLVDDINEYLSTLTNKNFMELGGIEYFIHKWKVQVTSIPYGTSYYMIDEHINDLRFRYIIDRVLEFFSLPQELNNELIKFDEIFKSRSTLLNRCVLSTRAERGKGLTKEANWYYYYLPTKRLDEWLPMLSKK